jgi:hypothetical protein
MPSVPAPARKTHAKTKATFDLRDPDLDFVDLGTRLGIATRRTTSGASLQSVRAARLNRVHRSHIPIATSKFEKTAPGAQFVRRLTPYCRGAGMPTQLALGVCGGRRRARPRRAAAYS